MVGKVWAVCGLLLLFSLPTQQAACRKYFTSLGETDPSVLTGSWVTLASTRKVMPCHTFYGHSELNSTTRLEETWMVPGWSVAAWRYSLTNRVASVGNRLQVTQHNIQGVLRGGRVGVGLLNDTLLLVQCSPFLWVPLPAFTVLARSASSNPKEDVRRILDHFQVPRTRQTITLVQHGGCEAMAAVQDPSRVARTTLDHGDDFWSRLLGWRSRPKWEIRDSPHTTLA